MKLKINGQEKEFSKTSKLSEIIYDVCKGNSPMIAEVNGQIIRNPQWEHTEIKDGDTIELVSLVGGG